MSPGLPHDISLGVIFSNGILGQIQHLFLSSLLRLSNVPVPKPIMTEAGPLSDPYSGHLVRVVGVGRGASVLAVQAQIMLEGSVVCRPTPFLSTSGTVDKLLNHTVSVFSAVKWEQHIDLTDLL